MENKDYIEKIEGAERRVFTAPVEMRASEDGMIEGVAAVVNSRTNLGWFDEEIRAGAFDDVLNDDVRVLFNHDPNMVLARSNGGQGTAELFITSEGNLGYRYQTPNTSVGKDLAENIRLGNVSQSSFAFSIDGEEWRKEGGRDVRSITKLKRLYDVSPVTYPAYQDTSVAKRSFDSIEKPKEEKETNLETYKRKLQISNLKK